MTINAYPLTWPNAFPRCKVRERGAFKTTLIGALKNVEDSLRKFAADSGYDTTARGIETTKGES